MEHLAKIGMFCVSCCVFVCVCVMRGLHLAAKNHNHSDNPYAQFRAGYDEAAVLTSPRISNELTKDMCSPTSVAYLSHPSPAWYADYPLLVLAAQDGAAFCIVANEAFVHANKLENRAIELVTMGLATDYPDAFVGRSAMNGADRWLWDDVTSGSKIFTQAGPSWDDVGVVELHNCFSASEARAEFTLV